MILYLLAGMMGFILAKLMLKPIMLPFFQEIVIDNIKLGKKVIICVDNEATLFEMVDHKIRITRAQADLHLDQPTETETKI